MDASQDLQSQLKDRIADLQLRGVVRVPVPKNLVLAKAVASVQTASPQEGRTQSRENVNAGKEGASFPCLLCPLCRESSISKPLGIFEGGQRPDIVVILDHPFSPSERINELQDETNPNHLVARLLKKAGLEERCHVTYAMRAPAISLPEPSHIEVCALNWLAQELVLLRPQQIACFGAYAREAYGYAHARKAAHVSAQVHYFPSSLELAHHPSWRKGVWERFRSLTQGSS